MSVLHTIQTQLKVGKGNRNEFGKYNYRNYSDILEAVKPLMPEGFYVTLSDDIVMVGDRYYVKAIATLTDGKTAFTVTAFARESFDKKGMDDSQITGATSSYARKYALNGLFAIDDTKDADSMDNSLTSPFMAKSCHHLASARTGTTITTEAPFLLSMYAFFAHNPVIPFPYGGFKNTTSSTQSFAKAQSSILQNRLHFAFSLLAAPSTVK